ncbi:acyl-CoA oxidase [Rhizodiscina lignyota]|uniref:Acyl-coenzyme A oxidase n=1 Tax=Rhizodiscina lignyota TaxID=1504668 RepID=A0A9P4M7B8_9PEZI|nr:acyl-CoA oxidase [Rhizodiscina lignyota]
MSRNPDWVKALQPSSPQGHELLQQERSSSKLAIEPLSEFLFGREAIERKFNVLQVLQSEPVFNKSQNAFDGRVQRFETALARAKKLRRLVVKHGWKEEDRRIAAELIGEPLPYALHEGMFLKTLLEQGTDEQRKLFYERAEKYEIIGCYAQTELGHGSNVRGLETTATWNADDKTFTLHSPYLTASKWWIGTLGRTANYAAVMAQLIVDGKSCGPHPFVVQIRDLKTHLPLDNIHIGDIGPKFGYNTMDNGFLLFNKVKIPHVSMLARFSRVDPKTNQYIRPSSPSLVYGTLTWIRSTIVMHAGAALAKGVTIAVRYCAIRRQFRDMDAPDSVVEEMPVLNYTLVQYRLLPLLAATFGLHFTGKAMMELYQENQKSMQANAGKGDLLPDLHAMSCGLKALASYTAAEGLEVCRRACGGHGYSSFSGVGGFYADYVPTTTWEGDNYMLTQQVARYLLKSARAVLNGESTSNDTTNFLTTFRSRSDSAPVFDVLNFDADLVQAFAWRAASMTFDALKKRDDQKMAWNDLLVDFYRLSKAHSQYLVVKNFFESLSALQTAGSLGTETPAVFRKLFQLYTLHTLDSESSDFLLSGAVTVRQIEQSRTTIMRLMKEIRPHAVRLVDAWGISDFQLDSSLGRYDGKVYEDMFHRASELNPLNGITIDSNPNSDVLFRSVGGENVKSKL